MLKITPIFWYINKMLYLCIIKLKQKIKKINIMKTNTVSELIRHFEQFESNYSVIGANEYSNAETLQKLRKMSKRRIFNVMNEENNTNCILIWE